MRFMADTSRNVLVSGRYLECGDKRIVNALDDRHFFAFGIPAPYLDERAGHPGIVTHAAHRPHFSLVTWVPALKYQAGTQVRGSYACTCPRVTSTVREAPDASSSRSASRCPPAPWSGPAATRASGPSIAWLSTLVITRSFRQARSCCRAAGDDARDSGAPGVIAGELHPQRGVLHRSGRNKFIGNTFGLIHRDGETQTDGPRLARHLANPGCHPTMRSPN